MQKMNSLPQDVIRGVAIITLMGRNSLHIENFKSIIEYDENIIKMRAKDSIITVTGERLKVKSFNCEEINITGIINEVKFGA